MTEHFVDLSCPNCGQALQIYDDMEQFACGHCGCAMAAQRRGGTVSLQIVSGDTGTARTVSGPGVPAPALERLKDEAANLSKQRDALLNGTTERNKWGYSIGGALLLIGFFVTRSGSGFVIGLSMLMAGILTISFMRRTGKRVTADVKDLQTKIDAVDGRIQDHVYRATPSA